MILPFVPSVHAAWQDINPACVSQGVATIQGIECIIANVLGFAPKLIALIAAGMLIIGGANYIQAGSDPKALTAAQNTITWAVIGLVLLSVGWLALVLIQNFTGAQVTQFGISN